MEARNGKVWLWLNIDDCLRARAPDFKGTPRVIAAALIANNIELWMNSSSMDFGRQHGFRKNDVRGLIVEEGRKLLDKESTS